MHTWTTRLNALVSHASFVLFVLAITNYGTSFWLTPKNVPVTFTVESITLNGEVVADVAMFRFSLKTDLWPLFNWNSKMLFLSIKAFYETGDKKRHEAVIWDRRVFPNTDECSGVDLRTCSNITLKNVAGEFTIVDPLHTLRNASLRLTYVYNRIPITGLLEWTQETHVLTKFPEVYTVDNTQKQKQQ